MSDLTVSVDMDSTKQFNIEADSNTVTLSSDDTEDLTYIVQDDSTASIDLEEEDLDEFTAEFSEIQVINTTDHSKLFNRDADNQHPISAITGLQDTLDLLEIEAHTKAYWTQHTEIIPVDGDLVIISDFTTDSDGTVHPALKVGDGIHSVMQLPSLSTSETIAQLSHSLTIGDQIFDGTADVVVPVYDGSLDELLTSLASMNTTNTSLAMSEDSSINTMMESANMTESASENTMNTTSTMTRIN